MRTNLIFIFLLATIASFAQEVDADTTKKPKQGLTRLSSIGPKLYLRKFTGNAIQIGGSGGGSSTISGISGLQDSLSKKINFVAGKALSSNDYTSVEKSKLLGIATGATANSSDATLLNRANHTGTQAVGTITGLSTVATSGAYNDLSGKPTLGTAAPLNVAVSGNAATTEVVKGNDTRLSDARTPLSHAHAETEITNLVADLAGKQANLGFTPYNSTNPNGYISAVPAQTYASLTGKPTTISGYGITDFNSLGDARWLQTSTYYNTTNPLIALKQSTTNEEWRLRIGIGGGIGNSTFNLYNNNTSKIALSAFSDGNIMIGSNQQYAETRLGVFGGGGSYGANVDVRGTTGAFTDQATIELEGANYDSQNKSTYLQYMGSSTTGTYMGFSKANMARLLMNGDINIIGTQYTKPIIFNVNDTEVARFDSLGKFGIGTITPSYKLGVVGTVGINGLMTLDGSTNGIQLNNRTNSANNYTMAVFGDKFRLLKNFSGGNGTPFVVDGTTGYVGIQQPSPTYPFDVSGDTRIAGNLLTTGTVLGSNLSGTNTGNDATNTQYASDYRAANFVAGTNYQAPLILTTTGTSGVSTLTGNTLNIPNYAGGGSSVWGGITGTLSSQTDLQSALDLKGALGSAQTWNANNTFNTQIILPVTTSATTGVIMKGSNRFLHDHSNSGTSGQNTWLGALAGNFTLTGSSSGTNGSYNVAVGYGVLSALTTGGSNTGIGRNALPSNTTGSSNTAIGQGSMALNTTGSSNTAIGQGSLSTNTGGSNNVILGYNSAISSTSSNNTIVGYSSAPQLSGGSNNTFLGNSSGGVITSGSANTIIGNSVAGLATGENNGIHIGTSSNNVPFNANTNGYVGLGNASLNPISPLSVQPVQYSTGTASQTTTAVVGVGTTWTAGMVGQLFSYANGVSSGLITAFNSATSLTVTTSQTVSSQAYSISYTGLQVGTTGNVGVNQMPTSEKLDIFGNIKASGNLIVSNFAPTGNLTLTQNSVVPFTSVNTGAVANNLYLNAGAVGINTSSPASNLDVSGSTGITFRTNNSSQGFSIYDRTGIPGDQLIFQGNAGNYALFNVTIKNATSASQKLSAVALFNTNEANMGNSTQFQMQNSPTYDGVFFTQQFGTGVAKKISFQTSWSQTSTPTQLVLATNGYVGVGTSSPAYNLDVLGTAYSSYINIKGSGGGSMKIGTMGNVGEYGAMWASTDAPSSTNFHFLGGTFGCQFNIPTGGIMYFSINNVAKWNMNSSGHWLTTTDNTVDIGASGATRPRTGYFGTSVVSPKYQLSALNTAPTSATDTGALGEIRVTATFIYVCTATNTWVRSALATW